MSLNKFPKYPHYRAIELLASLHKETEYYTQGDLFPLTLHLSQFPPYSFLYCHNWTCTNGKDFSKIIKNTKAACTQQSKWEVYCVSCTNDWKSVKKYFKKGKTESLDICIEFYGFLTEPEIRIVHLYITQLIAHMQKTNCIVPFKFKYENN